MKDIEADWDPVSPGLFPQVVSKRESRQVPLRMVIRIHHETLTMINNVAEIYSLEIQTFSAAELPRRIWRFSSDTEIVPS